MARKTLTFDDAPPYAFLEAYEGFRWTRGRKDASVADDLEGGLELHSAGRLGFKADGFTFDLVSAEIDPLFTSYTTFTVTVRGKQAGGDVIREQFVHGEDGSAPDYSAMVGLKKVSIRTHAAPDRTGERPEDNRFVLDDLVLDLPDAQRVTDWDL